MRKKHNNNDLLKIGDQLFRENGYHATGTEEILEKGEYPRSSFYYHFKNKEGFGIKTLEFYGENLKNVLTSILRDDQIKSPTERLKKYFFMICAYNELKKYNNCCLVQRFSIETGSNEEVLKKTAYEQFSAWVTVAEECIKEGQKAKEIRDDISTNELSEFLFSMIYGGHTIGRISGKSNELEKKMELAFKLIEA